MWKDFFYYSKGERRAIYVLLVFIMGLIVAIIVVPDSSLHSEQAVLNADSVTLKRQFFLHDTLGEASLFIFDPNLADSAELSALGLSSSVVRNVLKYRQKGGSFPTVESFSRIYGLTEEKFEELAPYIRISEVFLRKPRQKNTTFVKHDSLKQDTIYSSKTFKYPKGTLVDVNTSDTTELKKIPGIGSGIASAIVGYRNRLGGFYTLEQLKEIKYVTPELIKWFKLECDSVRRLDINRASLDQLRFHPYINFYQAKVIVEYRRKKGKITSLSQLSLYEEFAGKDLERIAAYIRFD